MTKKHTPKMPGFLALWLLLFTFVLEYAVLILNVVKIFQAGRPSWWRADEEASFDHCDNAVDWI